MTDERTQRVTGAVLAVTGVVVWFGSRDLVLIERGVPGPGFLPTIIAVSLVLLGVLLALRASAQAALEPARAAIGRAGRRRVGLTALCFAVYAVLVPLVGYAPATLVFCFALLSAVSDYSPALRVVVSVSVALLMYVVFDVLLGVALPPASLFSAIEPMTTQWRS